MTELFADVPRDTGGRGLARRRVAMVAIATIVALALLNVFGQEPTTSRAAGGAASFDLSAPETVRGGLLVQGRIHVVARRAVTDPQLVLAEGWFEAVGRRELSSMEPFDLILLVVIGDLVQQGVTQSDYSLTGATIVIATLVLLTVVTAYLSFRVRRLRPLLEGEPVVLVTDGDILDRNLRRQRVTRDELRAEARQQGIGSVADVRFAILETNGKISFLTRG